MSCVVLPLEALVLQFIDFSLSKRARSSFVSLDHSAPLNMLKISMALGNKVGIFYQDVMTCSCTTDGGVVRVYA